MAREDKREQLTDTLILITYTDGNQELCRKKIGLDEYRVLAEYRKSSNETIEKGTYRRSTGNILLDLAKGHGYRK